MKSNSSWKTGAVLKEEFPNDADPQIGIRVATMIPVDIEAVDIEVADPDEIAIGVRQVFAHFHQSHRSFSSVAQVKTPGFYSGLAPKPLSTKNRQEVLLMFAVALCRRRLFLHPNGRQHSGKTAIKDFAKLSLDPTCINKADCIISKIFE